MAGENINRRLNIYINDKEVVNSLRGVTREMTKTRNEINNLNKGAVDYDEKLQKLKDTYNKLSQEQAKFKEEISGVPSLLSKIKVALGPVASGMIAAFSIGSLVTGAAAALGNAKKLIFEFEQGVADLSAITGATGKDLDFLKNKAIELGEKTKGGAVAVLEAYQLIASAKPELLSNVDALNQVTEATLLLAKASGLELPEAATKLTDAMNQFNAPASEASAYVDVLAAGAKYGAAEIPQLTDAVLGFGSVAKVSNIDIKESVALSELLAEKGVKGAESGTKIRNILLQVMSGGNSAEARKELDKYGISIDDLKNKSIPFSEKLEKLKPLLKDVASVTKVFGTENATAAINLIENTNRLKELTSQVGEFGVAEQQAAIKMDTVNNKTELLKSKYESLILSIGKGSGAVSSFFKFFIDGASGAIDGLIKLNSTVLELGEKSRVKGSDYAVKMFNVNKSVSELEKDRAIIATEMDKTSKEINRLQKEFNDRSFLQSFNPFSKGTAVAKKEITDLYNTLGQYEGVYKKIQTKLNPAKTKIESEQKGGSAAGLSDEAKKAADDAAKKREKELADAKKHSEDLLKAENDLQKELNDSRAKASELKFGLIKDDYEREKALINAEYDKKIEDLQLNLKKEQEAINKLKAGIASPKTSSEDLKSFRKQLADHLEIQANYNDTLVSTNQTRDLKLGALQEKFLEKDLQKLEELNRLTLQKLEIRHTSELASMKTLAEAKTVLANYLTTDELAKVTSLEEAKKKIKEQHLKEDYNAQLDYLVSISTKYKELLNGQTVGGFKILTDEERDHIIKNAQDVELAIAKIKLAGDGTPIKGTREEGLKSLSSLDILGSSPEQWDAVFNNLGTAESKIQAVTAVVGGLQNAFGMYFQFLEAGEKRSLQKFESGINKKKAALSDQLEKGYISQDVYNARNAKLDQDLAKKKAEIEYKQAKRQKAMQAAQIISSTALSIMGIWAQVPKFDFGVSAGVLTGIVAGLGAAQLGLVLAQPLPDKNGFYDGGYTGDGNPMDVSTALGNRNYTYHKGEYMVPNKVLYSNDPIVPHIMGYLEAKRTGKNPQMPQEETTTAQTSQSGSSTNNMDVAVVNALNRNSAILEKIEEDGIPAFLENNIKTAKKMRDKIKEVNKLESNAKL